MDMMRMQEPEGSDEAKELYDMGKSLCAMAERMGYKPDGEGHGEDPLAGESYGKSQKTDKMALAMSMLDK